MSDAKEHILLTSLKLFLQKSFKEVTMKEIVDKTGLSKGAFYHYFSSKEQLFAEVISHYYTGIMTIDYAAYSQNSLKEFYTDILAGYETNRSATEQLIPHQQDEAISSNYYYLIFDAMRMLPDFRDNHQQEQKKELNAWKSVIATAKVNKEITTLVSDEELAKLFIYLGDGTNINLIINDNIDLKKNELKHLWDALYNSLKS